MEKKYEMPALTDEQRERLIEVATKRLGQYQKMKKSQDCSGVNSRCEIAFDYQLSIDLMQIALAALTAKPDHYKVDVYKGDRLIASCHPSEPEGTPAEPPYTFVNTAYYTAPSVTALEYWPGWKLVPIEPTLDMMVAGTLVSEFQEDPAGVYRAMIVAAPTQDSATTQIENDGWIDWKGGECPVHYIQDVEVKRRDSSVSILDHAHNAVWIHTGSLSDIIAYRVIENDGREG